MTTTQAKETFSRWEAADYLKSDTDMVAYIEACLEEAPDDAALLAKALGDVSRARGMMPDWVGEDDDDERHPPQLCEDTSVIEEDDEDDS